MDCLLGNDPKFPLKFSYPTATKEEVDKLKKLVRLQRSVPSLSSSSTSTVNFSVANPPEPAPGDPRSEVGKPPVYSKQERKSYQALFNGGIANVAVTIEPLKIDNPIQLFILLMPEITLYKWQFEQLMQIAGYLTPGDYKNKTEITDRTPYKLILSAANGSGKDMIIIAVAAIWFALTGIRNRIIITSSSFDQTKFQTEVHIRELANRVNKKFGKLFHFTQFHYLVPELGSEIKLFATDEPGRAEGYHPFPGGRMMVIMNEAKSIKEELFDALSRCTGYSHWLEISSPGPRRGHMFRAVAAATPYPTPAKLGHFYFRKVTAYECPHIPPAHIQAMAYEKGENSPWYRSSILAEFSDYDEPVVITDYAYTKCFENPPAQRGIEIGIGLDIAAGGDETVAFVRKGNSVIHYSAFRQSDTKLAASMIDMQLSAWKTNDYTFRADDGGIGHAVIDMLQSLGWRILRTNNQSPAYRKTDFLNLGAELYFYVKRLIERQEIIIPNVALLKDQLTSRRYKGEESTQGKFSLQSKAEARACGLGSPDRGDAFVLCFSTYRPFMIVKEVEEGPRKYTLAELFALERSGRLFTKQIPISRGRFTDLSTKI